MPETQRSSLRPPLASFLPVARRWRWMLLAAAFAAGLAGYVTAADRAAPRVARGHPRRFGELRRQRRPSGVRARRADLRRAGHDASAAQGDRGPPEDQQHLRRRHGDGQRHHAHPHHRGAQLEQEPRAGHRQHARPGARRLRGPAPHGTRRAGQPADRRPGGRLQLPRQPRSADRGDPGGDRGPSSDSFALALLLRPLRPDAVREAADVEEAAGVPCLATLPRGALRPLPLAHGRGRRRPRRGRRCLPDAGRQGRDPGRPRAGRRDAGAQRRHVSP